MVILEALFDHPAKLETKLELRRSRPARAAPGLAVCGLGAVAGAPAAAVDLPGDRRVGAAKRPGDGAGRVPASDPARDLLALFEAQAALGAPAGPGSDASRSRQMVAHAPPREAEPAPDLAIAQTFASQLPDPVLHRLAQAVAPWHQRTSFVGQQVADSLGWCGGGLNPPCKGGATATPIASLPHFVRRGSLRRLEWPAARCSLGAEAAAPPRPWLGGGDRLPARLRGTASAAYCLFLELDNDLLAGLVTGQVGQGDGDLRLRLAVLLDQL